MERLLFPKIRRSQHIGASRDDPQKTISYEYLLPFPKKTVNQYPGLCNQQQLQAFYKISNKRKMIGQFSESYNLSALGKRIFFLEKNVLVRAPGKCKTNDGVRNRFPVSHHPEKVKSPFLTDFIPTPPVFCVGRPDFTYLFSGNCAMPAKAELPSIRP